MARAMKEEEERRLQEEQEAKQRHQAEKEQAKLRRQAELRHLAQEKEQRRKAEEHLDAAKKAAEEQAKKERICLQMKLQQEIQDQKNAAIDMEGVDEYLPCRVMNAEERARPLAIKRTRDDLETSVTRKKLPPVLATPATTCSMSSLQAALLVEPTASGSSTPLLGQIPVEQDSYVLMEGDPEIWEAGAIEEGVQEDGVEVEDEGEGKDEHENDEQGDEEEESDESFRPEDADSVVSLTSDTYSVAAEPLEFDDL